MAKIHQRPWLSAFSALSVLTAAAGVMAETLGLRMWTDVQSRKIEAVFSGLDGDNVLLKLATGQVVPYPHFLWFFLGGK